MKTKLYPLLILIIPALFLSVEKVSAQTGGIGIGTTVPDSSAILDIRSTRKGVLVPRMTVAQRDSIALPARGLLVYQTDSAAGFYYYNSGWKALSSSVDFFADRKLSNLIRPTAVNADLLSDTTGTKNLGDTARAWKNLYLAGDIYMRGNRYISWAGANNNFFGTSAGSSITSGAFNTGTGFQALFSNTNGSFNTANGYQALYTGTGTYNTALGYQALYSNTTGYANNASGAFSLYSNTTGSYNTAYGADALIGNTTGSNNTAVGLDALRNVSTSSSNTGIGYYAGQNTYSSDQGTFLGAQTGGGTGLTNITAVGYGATATASNQVMLGNSAVTSVKAAGSFVVYSDGRFKKDIQQDVPGLDFINRLRPVTYHYKVHELDTYIHPSASAVQQRVTGNKPAVGGKGRPVEAVDAVTEKAMAEKEKKLYTGFVAQEVEAAAKKANYEFSGLYKPVNDKDVYGLSYSDFVTPLVKAVQELSKKNDEQQQQIDELKKMVTSLLARPANIVKR